MDTPGAVWMIDLRAWRWTLPASVERVRHKEGVWAFDTDSLAQIAESLSKFDRLDKPFAVFYEPPSFDDRVVNQYAMLSALSNPSLAFDDWLEATSIPRRKIIIPAPLKWEIRDKLDNCNINDRMLFPGLGGLCDWLKRFYGPGGNGSVKPRARRQWSDPELTERSVLILDLCARLCASNDLSVANCPSCRGHA